jgi:hypothetical protein|tara:strand:+ start:3717 stop:5135 length:1419 start_codon:yes stop_codon:yes gene_type:complete
MTEADFDFAARAAKFYAFEQQHDLFAVEVAGFSAWRVMRNFLFTAYQGYSPRVGNVPTGQRLVLALRALVALFLVLLVGRRRQVLFKGAASALRFRIDGKWADPGIDPLIETGISTLKLVELNSAGFAPRAVGALHRGAMESSIFSLLGRILGRLRPADDKGFCTRTAKLLSDELGLRVSPAALNMRVSTVMWQARLYALLIRRIRPDAVIASDTGDYALRRACQLQAVPFIEIQHGIFDHLHPDAVPDTAAGTPASLLIPDLLAVKGSYWAGRLQGFRQGEVAVPVGSHAIDHWRSFRSSMDGAAGARHIVVTSQGLAIAEMIAWLQQAVAEAPATLGWRMTVKLHPMYDRRQDFDVLATMGERVRILTGQEDPGIYELLATADLHLSITSACHFDAAAMGVRSAMMPLQNHESLMYAVDDGVIRLVERPGDLWQLLTDGSAKPDEEEFCISSYVERMAAVLQQKSGLNHV